MLTNKRTIATVGGIALAVASATSVAAQDAPGFIADGELSICMDPTFPPMEFMAKDGDPTPSGFDVDLANALGAYWGAEIKYVVMDFAGLLPSLAAERCDTIISGTSVTEERQQSFDAVPYLGTVIVLAGSESAEPFDSVDGLAGKTIAVQSGTNYVGYMEGFAADLSARGLEAPTVQQYPKQSDAIQQLLVGRADGVLTQDTEIAFRAIENPGKFKVLWTVETDDPIQFGIYFRKSETDKAAVQAAIAALKADGTLGGIVEAWNLNTAQLEGIGE